MSKSVSNAGIMYNHIRLWKQSGQSQKAYCLQSNIAYHIFHYWYGKYQKEQSTVGHGFIQLSTSTPASNSCFAECILLNGARIILHQPVPVDYLKTLAG